MIYFTGDIHGAVDCITDFINKMNPTMEDVIVLLGMLERTILYRPPGQHAESLSQ